ncbi:MAG: sulfite exporter TauE/SafE family protein [Rhizobiales bacterium]|nr:sulfite exporter TauE/SafE family protein [Hyphomicrobiales bacterium]
MIGELVDMGLWPEALSGFSAVFLIISSMFTSAFTAAFGLGGGVVMLALLVHFLPIAVVIPIHGVIQMGSNSSRAILLRHFIDWKIILYFLIGAIVGAFIGGQFVVILPEQFLLTILGLFILYVVWGPKPKKIQPNKYIFAIGGAIVTFLTMFIGATGPLLMSFLPRSKLSPEQISATHGMLMVVQHGLKLIIFGILGFQFFQWAIFLSIMVAGGFIGSNLGCFILNKLPEKWFKIGMNVILTLLALRMLYEAILLWRS